MESVIDIFNLCLIAKFDEHEISLLIESDMMKLHFPGRLSYGYHAVEVRSVLNAVQCVAEADFGGNLSSVLHEEHKHTYINSVGPFKWNLSFSPVTPLEGVNTRS